MEPCAHSELGVAVYANFPDLLDLQQHEALEPRNRFLFYFQHGQHWFQELAEQRRRVESLQFTAATSKDEIQRLSDKLQQRQHDDDARLSNGASTAASAAPVVTTPTTPIRYDAQRAAATANACSDTSTNAQLPQLRHLLYYDTGHRSGSSAAPGTVRLDLESAGDFNFWPCCEELVLVFQSLTPKDAVKVLSALMERAATLDLPGLGETFAVGVDLLREHERRAFLREYFLLVSPSELQDALQQRDECNDEKRWQLFVDELKDRLGIVDSDESDDNHKDAHHRNTDTVERPSSYSTVSSTEHSVRGVLSNTSKSQHQTHDSEASDASKRLAHFHSSEAKVGAKVLEMVELLEDLAVDASFLEPHQSGLSRALLSRLRAYEDPSKRVAKARELMMHASAKRAQQQQATADTEQTLCACHCGDHQVLRHDELAAMLQASAQPPVAEDADDADDLHDTSAKRKTSRRSSTLKRPLSAKRKNAVSFGSRLASSRSSTTQLRLFPLADVCHMLSAILHLQFSRDAAELALAAPMNSNSGSRRDRTSVVALSALLEDRWSFVRRKAPSFKTLAKDFLTRKYGIKAIAVMHTLQLERSLVHYASSHKHVRCALFAWFFGADAARAASRDFAFRFFQTLVHTLVRLSATKRPASSAAAAPSLASPYPSQQLPVLPFATLLSLWTEYIGDGDTSTSGALVRFLTPAHAIDACQCAFPVRMKETSAFGSFLETLYRLGLERDHVELEPFLDRAMALWLAIFDQFAADVTATLDDATDFDFDAFSHVVTARNGLELTGGERLELFDALALESDAAVVTRTKLLHFVLEAKYLRPSR